MAEVNWKQVQNWFEPPLTFVEIKELSAEEKVEIKALVAEAIEQEEANKS